jgi:uncharacterized protein
LPRVGGYDHGMSHSTAAVLSIFAGVLWTAPAHAQDCPSPSGRHVRVLGSATVRLPPDRVSFSVGVETLHANVSEAFRANARKVEAVLAALKGKGVESKELQTSDLEISSRNPDGTPAKGYRVANRVTVTRENAAGVGELIEAAITAGANEANRLSFYVADPGTAQKRGLDLAFASAHAKAETLATLAKQPLGEALCVSEAPSMGNPMSNFAPMVRGGAETVEAGTEAITFAVNVVFALGPAAAR